MAPSSCTNMYHVYLIQNTTNKKIYIGYTADLTSRIKKHNNNFVKSTKNRGDWQLTYCETYKSEKDARLREISLKKQGRQKVFLLKNLKNSLK